MQNKDIAFYLFINTVSGGNVGKNYLSIQAEEIKFRLNRNIRVFFYDLNNKEQKKIGVQTVKKFEEQYESNVIICGGDGSVLWVVQELLNGDVNLELIHFGIIPNGTGNDFSRTLGWGVKPTKFSQNKISVLKKKVQEWLKAQKQKYDIWDFEIEMYEDGAIYKIKDKQEVLYKDKILKRSFSNYFGIGIDARIGYSFQKRRTKNRFTNLLCYACIGLFKWCKSINQIDQIVENMEFQQSNNEEMLSSQQDDTQELQQIKKQLIFHTNKKQYGDSNHLKKGFKNILCMNSTSFMGAADRVWDSRKIAVENHDRTKEYLPQSYSDGMLQFVNFSSEFELGLERYLSGRGSKLAQGSGPFYINFRKNQESTESFFQIDGQFFKLKNPKVVKVQKSKGIPGSQINVLVKKKE